MSPQATVRIPIQFDLVQLISLLRTLVRMYQIGEKCVGSLIGQSVPSTVTKHRKKGLSDKREDHDI